jgi:NADH:ubiquinone oxidoreductase subunit 3 (subunit A)
MNNVLIVMMAACITAAAAALPKLLEHIRKSESGDVSRSYECGFQNDEQNFTYASKNFRIVAMFIATELVVSALLFSCALAVSSGLSELRTFSKYLSGVVLLLTLSSYLLFFRNEKSS